MVGSPMSDEKNEMVVDNKPMASGQSIKMFTERILKTSPMSHFLSNGFSAPSNPPKLRVSKAVAQSSLKHVCDEKLARELSRWREIDKRFVSLTSRVRRAQLAMICDHDTKGFTRGRKAFKVAENEGEVDIIRQLVTRLKTIESQTDDEATESSSGEEMEREETAESRVRFRRVTAKSQWEQHKACLRARWAILRARITEVERKLHTASTSAARQEHSNSKQTEGLGPASEEQPYLRHHHHHNHHHHPNGVPLGDSLVRSELIARLYGEEGCVSARTHVVWPRRQGSAPRNTLSRIERASSSFMPSFAPSSAMTQSHSEEQVDRSYHPDLSLVRDLSASLFIDDALHAVCKEHNFCPSQRMSSTTKRKQELLALPLKDTKDRNKIGKGRMVTKRNHTLMSPLTSPTSSRPSTPTQKRRKQNDFNIDNFVVPDVPYSPRLEKLEYKEIVTPSWRENAVATTTKVDSAVTVGSAVIDLESEEEDVGDRAVSDRHMRCEIKEKTRFHNFLTGGRKRRANSGTPSKPVKVDPHATTNGSGGNNETAKIDSKRKRLPSGPHHHHHHHLHTPTSPAETNAHFLLPWPRRKFPLGASDSKELVAPSPAPHAIDITIPRAEAAALGLLSPLTPSPTTPNRPHGGGKGPMVMGEAPAVPTSPEWMVNSFGGQEQQQQHPLHLKTVDFRDPVGGGSPHVVIKLTKRN